MTNEYPVPESPFICAAGMMLLRCRGYRNYQTQFHKLYRASVGFCLVLPIVRLSVPHMPALSSQAHPQPTSEMVIEGRGGIPGHISTL